MPVKCLPGSFTEPEPEVFTGRGCVGALGLYVFLFQLPRRNAGIQHKPPCLDKPFRHSEPLRSILALRSGSGGNPLVV